MDQLTMTEKNGENYILLELNGVLNSYTAAEFREKFLESVVKTNVVVDLSQVSDVDSTGMGVIMTGYNDGEETNHKLFIMNPSVEARKAIDDTGFSDFFKFIHSVTEAN